MILTGFGVTILLAFGVALGIYLRYVRYTPQALTHVPPELSVVARLDVEQAIVYEPFRKHLLELLEAGRSGPESRLLHIERKTTLELGVDTREVVMAWGPDGSWLLVLGGLFRRDGVVEGVGRLLREEGVEAQVEGAPPRLRLASGVTFASADDGALLLGSSAALVESARAVASPRVSLEPRVVFSLDARRPDGWPLGGGRSVQAATLRVTPGEDFFFVGDFSAAGPGWENPKQVFAESGLAPWNEAGRVERLVASQASGPSDGVGFRLEGPLGRVDFERLVAFLARELRLALDLGI